MTSGNPDLLFPVTGEEKEIEMLTVASIRTLKRGGNKNCRNEEYFRLAQDSIDIDILTDCWKFWLKTNPLKGIKSEIGNTYLYQKSLYNNKKW